MGPDGGQLEEDERFDQPEIESWKRDLGDLDDAGETFFNSTFSLVRKAPRVNDFGVGNLGGWFMESL